MAAAPTRAPAQSPIDGSVVIVVVDDLGIEWLDDYKDVTSQNPTTHPQTPPSGSYPETPILSTRLIPQGIRFTKAYATPWCSSTRATIHTGRYPFRTGIGTVIDESDDLSIYPRDASYNYESLARLVKQVSGFTAGAFGKWHLQSCQRTGSVGLTAAQNIVDSTKFKFDAFDGHLLGLDTADVCPAPLSWRRYFGTSVGNMLADDSTKYFLCETVSNAQSFMNSRTSPFLLWFAPLAPFDIFYNPPNSGLSCNDCGVDFHDETTNMPAPAAAAATTAQRRQCYHAAIEAVDSMLGKILDVLDGEASTNWYDTTTVIFIADNGTPSSSDNAVNFFWPQNQAKGTVHEGGIRVPYIIAGKAVTPGQRGTTNSALVTATDLYPTVAAIVGATAPSGLDGIDLTPILSGGSITRSYIYSETFAPNLDPENELMTNLWLRTAFDGTYKVKMEAQGPYTTWNNSYYEVKYDANTKKLIQATVAQNSQHANMITWVLGL